MKRYTDTSNDLYIYLFMPNIHKWGICDSYSIGNVSAKIINIWGKIVIKQVVCTPGFSGSREH